MAKGRLFEILYYLIDKKETTANELAEYFEVSVRTIYRDLDRLLVAGIPIITKQGSKGGVSLDKSYVLDKTLLDNHEQEQILLALQSLSSLQLDEYSDLFQRMKNIFQKESHDWIEVDFTSWHQNKEMNDKFNLLKTVIFKHQIISFEYINAHGDKSYRTVFPIKIFFKANAWYLQAYQSDKDVYRTYKLSRMNEICLHEDYFDLHKLTNIPQVLEYHEDVKKIDVILKFQKYLGSFVYDEFPYHDTTEDNDGYLVKTSVPNHQWLLSFLLSFGKGIEIIEPLELKQEYVKEIQDILNIYN